MDTTAPMNGNENEQPPVSGGGDLPPAQGVDNPEVPAAAAKIADDSKFGDPEGTRAAGSKFYDPKAEAAEESAEKKPIRKDDPISGALGAVMFGRNYSDRGWFVDRTRKRFSVWRYYMHQKIAIDRPTSKLELERDIPLKRKVLHSLGIAYVVVAPDESVTAEELVIRVEEDRKILADLAQAKTEADTLEQGG